MRAGTFEVTDALLGTSRELPTLDGHLTLEIPPGTQPDTVFRARGKGRPSFGDGPRGDLLVRKNLYEQLWKLTP